MKIANLNPIHDVFSPGRTEIWYQTPETHDRRRGAEIINGILPDPDNLHKTHRMVGKVDANVDELELIFMRMQGEIWSKHGEASQWIRQLGLAHTSMMVGDVVRFANGDSYYCAAEGWTKIISL